MNADKLFIQAAIAELRSPKLAVTKQYLAVMKVQEENGAPQIARVNKKSDNSADVYFAISGESFFLAIALEAKPNINVVGVWIESGHRVYLTASTSSLSYADLASMTTLEPLSGWSKGDHRRNGSVYDFSRIVFEPNKNNAYELETKLHELLDILYSHKKEVIALSEQSTAYISVCRNQYVSGNAGIHLDSKTIKTLQEMKLSLDIDTYITGKQIMP